MHSIGRLGVVAREGFGVAFSTSAKRVGMGAPAVSFEHLTRYLSNRDSFLERGSLRSREVKFLVDYMEKGDWHTIGEAYSKDRDGLAIDGLKAVEQEAIETSQLSTLMFQWSLAKDYPLSKIQVLPLFDESGNVNPLANNYISQTMNGDHPLSDAQLASFYSKMREKPLSERSLFIVESRMQSDQTIVRRIQQLGDNVFNEFSINGFYYEMVPSLSMMQEYLIAYGNESAITIVPTFNISSREDIVMNGKRGERDMALPFIGVSLPRTLDAHLAPIDLQCIRHDLHHCLMATNIPSKLRRAFIEYSEAILMEIDRCDNRKKKRYLEILYNNIIDMDFPYFKRFNPPTLLSATSGHFFHDEIPHPTGEQKFSGTIRREFTRAEERIKREDDAWISWIALGSIKAAVAKTLDAKDFFSRYNIPRADLV